MLTDALMKLNSAGSVASEARGGLPGDEFVPTIPVRDRSRERDT